MITPVGDWVKQPPTSPAGSRPLFVAGGRSDSTPEPGLLGRVEHDLSDDQWVALMEAWGGCAYCGGDGAALQKDCMLPISRGGRYTLMNVVPACGSCNASKCNSEVTTWLRRKKLDERAFLVQQAEIAANLSA